MRVMILASGDLWAGAEVMVYQLACGLAAIAEVELCAVIFNNEKLAEELKQIGVKVFIVDESKLSFPAIVHAVYRLAVVFSPDVIHSHRYKENLLACLISRAMRKVRLVSTQHGMPELARSNQHLFTKIRTWLSFRQLSCFFDRTVVVSEEMRRFFIGSYGFTADDVKVIHNGIRISANVTRHTGKRLIIGSAGRLFPVKDFLLMVDIAIRVVAENDMIDFVLAGDGPERLMVEEKLTKADLKERFRLLGHQSDMDAFYKSLDVYINTSIHEGIPMSVLEAMSQGLPVVVPNVGGFPEIVEDGVSGYLIDGRDPSVFSKRCIELVYDPQKRAQMAGAARQRVIDHFSREAMAANYYRLYQELIG